MIRRWQMRWPDRRPFEDRDGHPIRWLVVSDDVDPALEFVENRDALGRVDAVIGAGDLEPDYLGFLADAFQAPLVFVRGNHDRGGRWAESVQLTSPQPLLTGRVHAVDGIPIGALEWPGLRHHDRRRHDRTAWTDVIRLVGRRRFRRRPGAPILVLRHAPPRGVGDRVADPYHVGYEAYRWLLDRWHPPLWLHGHVPPASVAGWRVEHGGSTIINATGAVLLELGPPSD
jgi:uncharacterized protein